MKTVNNALIIITGTLLALLIGVVIQILFAFGTVDLFAFSWVQWVLEISYLLLCISIGLRVSISILLEGKEFSLEPVKIDNEKLEQAMVYIDLLEKHIRYNDNQNPDIPYVPYDSTELEIQIQQFKNKYHDNRG